MTQHDLHARQRTVTEEPFILAEEVKGLPLASIRRRGAGFLCDGLLMVLVGIPLLAALMLAAVYLRAPNMARSLVGSLSGSPPSLEGTAELLGMVGSRRPSALPGRFGAAVAEGDMEAVVDLLATDNLTIDIDPNEAEPSYYDSGADRLHVHRDVVFGSTAPLVSLGIAFLYFGLLPWIGNGRTPGKWLFGMRAVRLRGGPLRLWDAISRAGGYAASASLLGLGFFEAAWDPNRQTVHDRVAGTVVVREPRRGPRPRAQMRNEPSATSTAAPPTRTRSICASVLSIDM